MEYFFRIISHTIYIFVRRFFMDDIKKQLEDDDEILWKGMPEKSPYLTALHA